MLLAGISAQTRLRLKTYRSDGGVKIHRLNDHGNRSPLKATGMTKGKSCGFGGEEKVAVMTATIK